MRRAAAAVAAAAALAGCGDGPQATSRLVCGDRVEVRVEGGDVAVDGDHDGEWRLAWLPEGAGDVATARGRLPLEARDTADGRAWVTTPDAACTALVGPPPAEVRVIGDSLAFHVARAGLAAWEGLPGEGWAAVTADPASAAVDQVRGAAADEPAALVLVFGANDALWVAGADDSGARLRAVAAAVDEALAAAGPVACVLAVTPSAGETVIFGLGPRYAEAANAVAAILRERATVVDWTEASATHHLPDGTDGDWFPDGDEIHPNDAGRRALVTLVDEAVARC